MANVGKVLRLNWATQIKKIILPSALPFIFTGMRLSLQDIDLPRPRTRKDLLGHDDYYAYRESILTFLNECGHTH